MFYIFARVTSIRLNGGDTMSMWRTLGSLTVLAVLLGGCGGGGGMMMPPPNPDAGGSGGSGGSGGGGGDAGCSAGSAPASGQVTGSWAGLQVTLSKVNAVSSEQVAKNIYLYEQTQASDGTIMVTETMCDLKVDDTAGLIHIRVTPQFAP